MRDVSVAIATGFFLLQTFCFAQVIPFAMWKRSPPPVPRLISTSYFTDWSGTTYKSPSGMSRSNYVLSTTGVVNGDLLIVMGTIDAYSAGVWPNPFSTGFTQLAQTYYGGDGEAYFIAWKIANNEPATYSGTYITGTAAGSTVLTLIAVSGANQTSPINVSSITNGGSTNISPVTGTSSGVTTTVSNTTLIYVQGVDWLTSPGTGTFTTPTGFTNLSKSGDGGASGYFDWGSQQVAYKYQAAAGATGSITGGQQNCATSSGVGWLGVIAVAPP